MLFSDVSLSRRLERAEGHACLQFAEARRRALPDSGSEWIECAGAYAVFDGVGSPTTQSFGLGLFEELTPSALDRIERFDPKLRCVATCPLASTPTGDDRELA